jgi:peptidoglycan/xylan/chitin deacetylase (PgdA/CDA1 family)
MAQMVKAGLRTAATTLLRLVPVGLWRRLFPKRGLGVCYHIVSNDAVPHVRHYPVLGTSAFEADLIYLSQEFGFVSYDEVVLRRSDPGSARDNAVVLTFDDGFAECATNAAPILRRHGIDCVFFVITDLIDSNAVFRETEASLCIGAIERLPLARVVTILRELGLDTRLQPPPRRAPSGIARRPLDMAGLANAADPSLHPLLHWLLTVGAGDADLLRHLSLRLGIDPESYARSARPYLSGEQIRQLRANGFTIGAHSRSHRWLQDLPRDEAAQEIVESCRIIRDLTGQASVPFAFPYFGGGIDRAWLAQLRQQHDFIGLFFDTGGMREDAPFVVQRVFGERIGQARTLPGILRQAWAEPSAWRRERT